MERKKKVSRPLFCGMQNIAGKNIKQIRLSQPVKMSQNDLAIQMQLAGIPIGKNKVQKIEQGQCSLSDIELVNFAKVLHTTVEQLLDTKIYEPVNYKEDSSAGVTTAAQYSDTYGKLDYQEPEDK